MESNELDENTENNGKSDKQDSTPTRWNQIDLGLMPKIFKGVFVNISDKVAGILTILTTITMSLSDIISDILVAISLFTIGEYTMGFFVLLVDFIPSWTLATHNLLSGKWKSITISKDKYATVFLVLISPFSSVLFHVRWLAQFESADEEMFEYLHHNSRLSQLLNGSYESPLQIVILLILWGSGTLKLPWMEDKCFTDSKGRVICLGILPAIFSLTISMLSIVKGSLDISEGRSWQEKFIVFVYALCNYMFRLPTIALLVIYFSEWCFAIFTPIFLLNLVLILRYDRLKRKDFSIGTTVLIATISPFIASDQTNLYQKVDTERQIEFDESENKYRRQLSAKISMASLFILFLSNLALYLLLEFDDDFITPILKQDLILEKNSTKTILLAFLFPLGCCLMVSNILYHKVVTTKTNSSKNYYSSSYIYTEVSEEAKQYVKYCALKTLAFVVFVCVVMTSCFTVYYLQKGKIDLPDVPIGGTSINPVIDPGEELITIKISTTTWKTERKTDSTTEIIDSTTNQDHSDMIDIGSYRGWIYVKVKTTGIMSSSNVANTCEGAGLTTPCSVPVGCYRWNGSWNDGKWYGRNETRCQDTWSSGVGESNSCKSIFAVLPSSVCDKKYGKPNWSAGWKCPTLDGVFPYDWLAKDDSCGILNGTHCTYGNRKSSKIYNKWSLCAKQKTSSPSTSPTKKTTLKDTNSLSTTTISTEISCCTNILVDTKSELKAQYPDIWGEYTLTNQTYTNGKAGVTTYRNDRNMPFFGGNQTSWLIQWQQYSIAKLRGCNTQICPIDCDPIEWKIAFYETIDDKRKLQIKGITLDITCLDETTTSDPSTSPASTENHSPSLQDNLVTIGGHDERHLTSVEVTTIENRNNFSCEIPKPPMLRYSGVANPRVDKSSG